MATPSSASIDSIHRAYVAYYGRPADHAGLMYWANVLDQNGGNLDAVIQSFGNSAESTALYGGNSTVERIDKIYAQLFNRPAEDAGRNWWAQEIDAGRVTLPAAALAILNGAMGNDLALIDQKVVAARLFTDTLQGMGMSHAYGANDIDPARAYLSEVTVGMSDADLQAHLDETMSVVQNASLLTYSTSNVLGPHLGGSDAFTHHDGTWLFGDTARINSSAPTDAFLATLDASMTQGVAARVGHADLGETLLGVESRGDNGFLAWGDLDGRSGQPTSNLTFLWSLNADLQPVAAAHLGTDGGNAPVINDVTALADGRILVVGSQNSVADGRDAFVMVLNRDLTVHAQKTFDGPAVGSNESFSVAHQLQDGSLMISGTGGELFRMDQNLNVLASRDLSTVSVDIDIDPLENGLFLVHRGNSFLIMDNELNVLSTKYAPRIDDLEMQTPGHFVAYEQFGIFYNLHINVSDPFNPTLEFDDAKQITTRNGIGARLDRFDAEDGVVNAIENNNVFSFRLDIDASPNLAADYRLQDHELAVQWDNSPEGSLVRPDWQVSDLQIVTVGSVPAFTPEASLIQLTGVTAI